MAKTKGRSREGDSIARETTKATSKSPTCASGAEDAGPTPPPPPPQQRDETIAPRDVARLLRYGAHFGPHKIDIRMLPLQLPIGSGSLAVFDPGVPKSWRVFERPVGSGAFRVMLSVARTDDKERLAAVVIHFGRPPIAKWTVAHYQGQRTPRSAEALPRIPVTTGWLALLDAGDESPGVVAVPQAGSRRSTALTDGRRALALPPTRASARRTGRSTAPTVDLPRRRPRRVHEE